MPSRLGSTLSGVIARLLLMQGAAKPKTEAHEKNGRPRTAADRGSPLDRDHTGDPLFARSSGLSQSFS